MLLNTYESKSLLCNLSVKGATTQPGVEAFRGDLVLREGEIADDAGRRLPPTAVIKQAAILVKNDKLEMIAGALTDLAHLPLLIEMYKHDLAPDVRVLFYVENIGKNLTIDVDGVICLLQPHAEGGAVWSLLMDDLRLDKDDFKGQSPEDKVITIYDALLTYKIKSESPSLQEALNTCIVESRRETRGPV